jgi:hypothetical protein
MATPKDLPDIRRLLGMASFYRRWIADFANITVPLTDMLKKIPEFKFRILTVDSRQSALFAFLQGLLDHVVQHITSTRFGIANAW